MMINDTKRRMEKVKALVTLASQFPELADLAEQVRAEFMEAIDGDEIFIRWSSYDIIDKADEDGVTLTEEQARAILTRIGHYHDCTVGISWDVISVHIDEYLNGAWQEA
jgi:hypothetical protein